MARWKLGPQGAYFDPNDTGPDQVSPPPAAQAQPTPDPSSATQGGTQPPWMSNQGGGGGYYGPGHMPDQAPGQPWQVGGWGQASDVIPADPNAPDASGTQVPWAQAGDMSKGGIWNWLQGNAPGFGDQHVMGAGGSALARALNPSGLNALAMGGIAANPLSGNPVGKLQALGSAAQGGASIWSSLKGAFGMKG